MEDPAASDMSHMMDGANERRLDEGRETTAMGGTGVEFVSREGGVSMEGVSGHYASFAYHSWGLLRSAFLATAYRDAARVSSRYNSLAGRFSFHLQFSFVVLGTEKHHDIFLG